MVGVQRSLQWASVTATDFEQIRKVLTLREAQIGTNYSQVHT